MRQVSIIFTLLFTLSLTAQQLQPTNWCGSLRTPEERALQKERLLNNLRAASIGFIQQRTTVYVPIDFCLVAESDGSNRISEGKVLDQLCRLNEDFANLEIQFFLKDGTFSYYDHTGFYENHAAYQNTIMTQQRNNRALNLFVVKSVDDGQGDGTTLAYYHTVRDWIVSRKASVGDLSAITHEVGHFFSLHHPFSGWEAGFYTTEGVAAPAMSSGGFVPTEWQNGENCETAGDFICDTPPDYGAFGPCNFTANILDPNGDQIHPDEQNVMSYFQGCDPYHFSTMQGEAMVADYSTTGRNYLRIGGYPDVVEINGQTTHIAPLNNETTDYFNYVELQWEAVDGADSYFVEVSRVASFSVNPVRVVTNETGLVLENLEADKKYYWRVRPFNAHKTCMGATSPTSFRTGTITSAVSDVPEFINTFTVTPNPVASNQVLNIVLESNESFEGSIRMVDITGRVVQNIAKNTFYQGENRFTVETNSLANGLYILQLQTDAGQISRKVIVSN